MKTLYVALSLTHVKTESDRQAIREFLRWIDGSFGISRLPWAFDTDTWQPKEVGNIFEADTKNVLGADLALAFYPSDDGSDGRGGEVALRITSGKPIIAIAKRGVRVSRYAVDGLKTVGVEIIRFDDFHELEEHIRCALMKIAA